MLIRLQPDQISLFWETIREGMIKSYQVPDKFAQDFAVHTLTRFLTGDLQCWMGYEERDERKYPQYFAATQIVNNEYFGTRSLWISGFYSLVPVTQEMLDALRDQITPYAKVNKCQVVLADYSNERIKRLLFDSGFEHYKSTARLMLGGN